MPAPTSESDRCKIDSRPFLSAPAAQRYFPASVAEDARLRISLNVERSSGVALIIAGAGLGKSMLLEVLATQFASERPVISLAGAQLCTRRALLQMILFQLGLPFRDLTEGELRLSILTHLQSQSNPRSPSEVASRLLLLVDEAESLPVRLLEELRVLTNVAHAGYPLVDIVLAGGPALEERLAEREMEALSQRVSVRCYLAPFGREETLAYIRAQVNAAGENPDDYFTQAGLEAMFSATDGIPRLINQLGNQLAWSAEERSTLPINEAAVQAAWAEIQQLPAPWNVQEEPLAVATPSDSLEHAEKSQLETNSSASSMGESHVFEFGGVDDADAESVELELAEEAMPASIPFARAEDPALEISTDATIDATERLLAELGELGSSEVSLDFTDGSHASESGAETEEFTDEPANCDDPFGDGFDEEEIVIDQFGDFEPSMLAFAPDVMNFMDLSFAQDLDTVATAEIGPNDIKPALAPVIFEDEPLGTETLEIVEPTELDEPEEEELELQEPVTVSQLASTVTIVEESPPTNVATEFNESVFSPAVTTAPSKLLVLEDDGRGAVEIVPGRQFRRLFSTLEAGS